MPNNTAIKNHPLVNTRAIFRPHADPIHTWGNSVVIAPGMNVLIKAVFHNWNDVKGLTMLYVYVPETGKYTHVSPEEMTGEKYGDLAPVETPYPKTLLTVSLASYQDDGCCYTLTYPDGKTVLLGDGMEQYHELAAIIDDQHGEPEVEAEPKPVNVFADRDTTTEPTILRVYAEDQGDEYPWCIDGMDLAGNVTDGVLRFATLAEALFAAPTFVSDFPSLAQGLPDPTD